MAKLILTGVALTGIMALASCTTVKEAPPATTSTTTESTSVQPVEPPVSTTTTQTVTPAN